MGLQKVNEVNIREAVRHKKYYDHKFRCIKLMLGDTVLVRIKAFGVDRKITDRWEQRPYIVVDQILNQPGFKVKPIGDDDDSGLQTLHRNMLFPIQSL